MEEHPRAAQIADALVEREYAISTIECGTDGQVSHTLFNTDYGPNVLGSSLVLDKPEQALDIIPLPLPQLKKAGVFSAKAARAVAREGRPLLGVQVCVVVWAQGMIGSQEGGEDVYLALSVNDAITERTLHVEGPDALDQVVDTALDMVAEGLEM